MTVWGARTLNCLSRISILDVAPTVLHLLGLPVPNALEGKVLVEALDPGWFAAHPTEKTSAYPVTPRAERPEAASNPSPAEERIQQELRALGYIE